MRFSASGPTSDHGDRCPGGTRAQAPVTPLNLADRRRLVSCEHTVAGFAVRSPRWSASLRPSRTQTLAVLRRRFTLAACAISTPSANAPPRSPLISASRTRSNQTPAARTSIGGGTPTRAARGEPRADYAVRGIGTATAARRRRTKHRPRAHRRADDHRTSARRLRPVAIDAIACLALVTRRAGWSASLQSQRPGAAEATADRARSHLPRRRLRCPRTARRRPGHHGGSCRPDPPPETGPAG